MFRKKDKVTQNLLMAEEKPLVKVAEAFGDLAATIGNGEAAMKVASFAHACSLVYPLIRSLGFSFKFAELDFAAKVNDITEASRTIATLPEMVDADIAANTAKVMGSHTRNLLKVKRGLELIKVLYEEIIATEGDSFIYPAWKAYDQVIAPYHEWTVQKIVGVGLNTLPTRGQLTRMMNEDASSVKTQMQNYVTAVAPVIKYVDELFNSRGLGIDW